MELSPKQQSVELIKKASRILVLGHKRPDGDMVGSLLSFAKALNSIGKTAEVVVSEDIPGNISFLPFLSELKNDYRYIEGKLLRIDTDKIPVKGMKYQKNENFLDIILDAEKNIKYEHIEIINGVPKPDLIVVLDTPDVKNIDSVYDKNTTLFYEVPIINIDHHPGNDYFGTVNLIDLTASSTAEILVSLFEALGVKINNPDISTLLLTGIISDTQSFRSSTTTPKSLTVAAQLLASGARQQEIIKHLYKKRPVALLKLWASMLNGLKTEKNNRLAWTKISLKEIADQSVGAADVLEAIDELLANNPKVQAVLVMVEDREGVVWGRIKGINEGIVDELINALGATGKGLEGNFTKKGKIDEVELSTLKKIHDAWNAAGQELGSNVWDVIESKQDLTPPETTAEIQAATDLTPPETEEEIQATEEPLTPPQTEAEIQSTKEDEDAIENALRSLSDNQTQTKGFTPLKEIMDKKLSQTGRDQEQNQKEEDIDVFDEENE